MNRIKRIVANANVAIAFFIHLQIIIIRDVTNVRKKLCDFEIIVPVYVVNE